MPRSGRFVARPDTGRRAEQLAAALLERAGLRIVARNWRHPGGELDIVADDGGTCVFVEVRSRTGEERGHALETIDARKRARVVRAARLYLQETTIRADAFRFDVVAVTFDPRDAAAPPALIHIPNAFEVT